MNSPLKLVVMDVSTFFSASILIFASIRVFILPSSYGRLEMPMLRDFEAWEDDAFILPSTSHATQAPDKLSAAFGLRLCF